MISRHISLDEEYIKKLEPYLERNNGNIGTAIKEIINQVEKCNSIRNNYTSVDMSILDWMLKETEDILIPENILDEFVGHELINSMNRLEKFINNQFNNLNWDIELTIKADRDTFPTDLLIEIRGPIQKIKFVARMTCQYIIEKTFKIVPLAIKSVTAFDDYIKIDISRSNEKESIDSIVNYLGKMEILKIIKTNSLFWKAIIKEHTLTNYNMITIHKNYFEDLLSGNIPSGDIMVEILTKKPIQEIPLKEMLLLLKEIYENARIADKVEIDRDNLILYHNYRNKEAIEKLKKIVVALLDTNGHLYDAKSTSSMILFTHRPDVGIKINEIVDKLNISNNRVDQELIMFLTFLKGLKDLDDIPLSFAVLGRRIGKSLMREYKEENGINNWDIESFKKAIESIDMRLHRESELKIDKGVLTYTIKKCSIATEENQFNPYICHTTKEVFKGALDYVFGNKIELEQSKSILRGDKFCEVTIRTR